MTDTATEATAPTEKSEHEVSDFVLTCLKSGVNPLLVGPAGCGKTTIARNVAKAMNLPFYYTGAVKSAFQLRGFVDAHGRVVETTFVKAYRDGGVFLLDEMDGSDPNAMLAVHGALDNEAFDTPGGQVVKHPNLYFIGAANTWGNGATLDYMGRNHLDSATLDRFVTIPMDYDTKLEEKIVADNHPKQKSWPLVVQKARAAARVLSLHHVISTRACINGAKLLDKGMPFDKVVDTVLMRGLAHDTKIKVLEAIKKDIPEARDMQKNLEKLAESTKQIRVRFEELGTIQQEATKIGGDAQNAIRDGRKLIGSALELTGRLDDFRNELDALTASITPLMESARRKTGQLGNNPQPR